MLLLFYFVWLVGGIEIDVYHDGFGNFPAEENCTVSKYITFL